VITAKKDRKHKMGSEELEELTAAIMDGILDDAKLSIEKHPSRYRPLPKFATRPKRLLAYDLEVCNAKKEALEDALYDLLLEFYGLDHMETEAFDRHQELVIQPRIAQSETDAAVDNHEAQLEIQEA
jgi:hypothetical protein